MSNSDNFNLLMLMWK